MKKKQTYRQNRLVVVEEEGVGDDGLGTWD